MDPAPRPTSPTFDTVVGVAAALMTTLGAERGVDVLLTQFGWDLTFSVLARLPGPHGGRGLWLALVAEVAPHSQGSA